MKCINKEYRSIDKATDVLSFPQISPNNFPLNNQDKKGDSPVILGDVVVSLETADYQSKLYGYTFEEEFSRLLIHGILHLTGYDHEGVSRKKELEMKTKEQALFDKMFL